MPKLQAIIAGRDGRYLGDWHGATADVVDGAAALICERCCINGERVPFEVAALIVEGLIASGVDQEVVVGDAGGDNVGLSVLFQRPAPTIIPSPALAELQAEQ